LEAWRYFTGLRKRVGAMFCQPAYELVLEEMVDRGMVQAPDYYSLHRAYAAARWIGPGRGWVDPVKEIDAAVKRMKGGMSTLEMECAEQGLDWEEVMEQQATERDRASELGLPDPYAAAPQGGAGLQQPYPSDVEGKAGKPDDEETAAQDDPATAEA
jgi:capsid protein